MNSSAADNQNDEKTESEVELLERRMAERQRDLEDLERELDRVEKDMQPEPTPKPESDASRPTNPSAGSNLEPQYRAHLGGADRKALEVFALRHHNHDQSFEHLRTQTENLHRKIDGLAEETLATLQRLEMRAEYAEHRQRQQQHKVMRLVGMVLGVLAVIALWYLVARS